MNSIFTKLNYKDQPIIHVLQAPESFQSAMQEMNAITQVKTEFSSDESATFVLAFVTQQSEIDALTSLFSKALQGDGVLWFAYPKGTSKRYKCDFNRDTGWHILGQHGFEGVRQVAIDEDWSALRFRRAEYIKTMKRAEKRAMSEIGRTKIKENE
ncbi:MAG: hypothetical protein ACK4TA_04165 [Saprospiraceae bacterium]